MYDNNITKFINLKDADIEIKRIDTIGMTKVITLEKRLFPHYCPLCGFKMHSRGIYQRTVNHPILQDGFALKLKINQRTWRCINDNCRFTLTDEFSFVEKYRQNTNITDLLIVEAFRDCNLTASQIADKYNVSDTYAIYTFERYVNMKRRGFTEAICVDEVHVGISRVCNYALVIQDFATGEPIDMIINRRKEVTEPYFLGIPKKERDRVKYLVSDMYRPYTDYVNSYFHNAVSVVDSFHVVKLINNYLLIHLRKLQGRYRDRDQKRHEELEQELGRRVAFTVSREYYLLKNFKWLILKNRSDIPYSAKSHLDRKYNCYMSIYDYEHELHKIDSNILEMRDLKEKYITFNNKYSGNHKEARQGLKDIIEIYRNSKFKIFNDISYTLEQFQEQIVNSFIMIERIGEGGTYLSRLSNGPMESLNRIPKDMKRNARGYRNFYHLRNRFLFSQRRNAAMLAVPRTMEEVCPKSNITRGPYTKKIKAKLFKK